MTTSGLPSRKSRLCLNVKGRSESTTGGGCHEYRQANLPSSTGGLYIGAGSTLGPGTFWKGLLDDVRIYSQAVKPWHPVLDTAHKDPGSRQSGWETLRERLKNVTKPEGPRRFVFNTCRRFIRTVPVLSCGEMVRWTIFGMSVP